MRRNLTVILSISLCFATAACGALPSTRPVDLAPSTAAQAQLAVEASIPKGNIITQSGDGFVISVPPHVAEYFETGANGDSFNVPEESAGEWTTIEEKFSPITNPSDYPVPPELWEEPLKEASQEVISNNVPSSSARVIARKSEPAESFTKRTVSRQSMRRIGPQILSAYVDGNYRFEVSAEGKIRLVKVSGGGEVNVKGGIAYTGTKYACAYFQTERVERYIRFREYNYYSDGRKVATGGYHDQLQPAFFNDTTTRRVGNWTIC